MKTILLFKNPALESVTACHQGLGITADSTALSLREQRLDATAYPVSNGEYVWSQLAGPWSDATHVVLEAPFVDAPFLGKLFAAFPNKRFTLVYHSNLGFLAQDGFAGASLPLYMALESQSKNFCVAANSQKLAEAMQAATGLPFTWLPNLYHLPAQTRREREPWRAGHVLNVGLFGASRVLKNWLTATVATMIMARTLGAPVRFHVSTGRDEGAAQSRQNLQAILGLNPAVTLVSVPWLSHDDFLRYLYGLDMLLQPSFTETFNNVTADGCACGVPSVVSPAVGWAPADWIAEPDSAVSIAKVGCALMRNRNAGLEGWKALDAHNQDARLAWTQWLMA